MSEDTQLWILLTDTAVSSLPFVCLPAMGIGAIVTWLCGRLLNRAWGVQERNSFLPLAALFSLFLLCTVSLTKAIQQLHRELVTEQTFLSPAAMIAADSLPSSVNELTWQDLRRCQDGTLKSTEALVLRLTEDCLQGEETFAALQPHRRDIPSWKEEGLHDVYLQLNAVLADPHAKAENRHDFYRKLTALCYATRMRCAARVCAPLPRYQAQVQHIIVAGSILLGLLSSWSAYRAIRVM